MIIGLSCIVAGLIFRLLAMRALGRDFTLTLSRPSRIVTRGIYRIMRHPSYFGSLLVILGLSVISPILGVMALAFAFFMARIVEEERILKQNRDYIEYANRVGVFFPKNVGD